MVSYRANSLDQQLDISGSLNPLATLNLANEPLGIGRGLSGQSGAAATITVGGTVVVTGLTGMNQSSEGYFLRIFGAGNAGNNGIFLITNYIGGTSVEISNISAVNESSLDWEEHYPYSLQDDLNYERTDREAIKGVSYYLPVPTYTSPTNTTLPINANLNNIAGKTTDAKAFVINRKFENEAISVGNTFVTLVSSGNLRHATAINRTGIPISDGSDAGNPNATYADIIDGYTGVGLYVLGGVNAGNRVFGRTRAGSSTSPNSVEVEFRSVPDGDDISGSIAYTWESGQPSGADVYYGWRDTVYLMDENALRVTQTNGLISDSGLRQNIIDIQTTIGITDGDTDLAGLLTNTTNYFAFSDLPDITPSVVEALNVLNEQIGNRSYSTSLLTDGYTITQSLEELAAIISAGGTVVTRAITRNIGPQINPGTPITLPGALNYSTDVTNNGSGMMVFWRGVLRDPGTILNGDDYEETNSTQITSLRLIKTGDHINFVILS